MRLHSLALHLFPWFALAGAQDPARRGPDELDVESTAMIGEYTTSESFSTEWVDHVPQSAAVPSPRDFLGYVVGTPGRLTAPEDIVAYFRELERTSDRLRVVPMGQSHGGRGMVVALIADASVLEDVERIQAQNRALADPRTTTKEQARAIASSIPPTYYVTAGLHSTETGPPEMVMELAYRLVVSDQDHIREIREQVLTMITPVLEMDGRARTIDWHRRFLGEVTDLDDSPPRSPPYWGDYTFHDNNRDGLQVSQPLTRNYNDTFHEFLPTVSLDLHESVPLLYVSLGTGPYNETIDPITVTEWQWLSSYDVSQATKLGLPGVWTWGFYTGWYPGYLLWVTNNHNAVGRFYETFGNSHAGTFERDLKNAKYADKRVNARQWYRAWPPERKLTWSLRNNTNYMQTGVLASLQLAARNGETLLFNYWQKGFNSLEKGRSEAPYAFHIPADQRDKGMLRHLLWLLEQHRIEVHRASRDVELAGGGSIASGDFVVRMDQPYRNFAKTLLEAQRFPKSAAHSPYDDISWSLEYMLGVDVEPVEDAQIQEVGLELLDVPPELEVEVQEAGSSIVAHRAQASLASLCFALPDAQIAALREPWSGYAAGSLVIRGPGQERLGEHAARLLLDVHALPAGDPPTIDVNLPRVALYHTWTYTQDSGWARYTLEELAIPYTLIDKDDLLAGELHARFDVIVVPDQRGDLKALVHGIDRKW